MPTSIYAIIGVLFASMLGAAGALFLKLGSDKLRFNFWSLLRNRFIYFGVFFYGISTLIFIPQLRYGELSILYPVASTTYIWVILLSNIVLKERIGKYKIAGICGIIIGIVLLNLGN